MIDITDKEATRREAVVEGRVSLKPSVILAIKKKKIPKGDVLEAARLAGIMAVKKTHEIIPLCHPIPVDWVDIKFSISRRQIKITTTVRAKAKTGVEMEAFAATAISCLAIYDMCKSLDRGSTISEIRLLRKSGRKSGLWER